MLSSDPPGARASTQQHLETGSCHNGKNFNYHQHLLVETSFSHYQPLVGSRLNLRDYQAQVGEMLAGEQINFSR